MEFNAKWNADKYPNEVCMIRSGTLCQKCTNRACLFYRYSARQNSELLNKNKNIIKCRKGQQVFLEGMPVAGIYFLLKGKVKIYKSGTGGKQQVIRLVRPGDIMGHRGIGVHNIYPVGATALEDSQICFIETRIFFEILRKDPQLTFQLMLFYANELQKMETYVRNQALMSIREKVAGALMMIADTYGLNKEGKIDAHLSRQDIAEIAGTNKEQVSRFLSEFQKQKLISVRAKFIRIVKPDKLKGILAEYEH